MTEKEKMLAHQMYDANYNEELHDERIAAKELCWEYNQLRPSNEEGQRAVLKKLLGKTGENSTSLRRSGAIMATTSNWAKISTPTTTWSSLIALR